MGVVYAAYDPSLDRRIAIKIVSHDSTRGDATLRLEREARALAKLNHPNVVAVHEVGMSDGRLFIAMEYIVGKTIHNWLKAATRSAHEVIDLLCEAGRGLAAAHGVGLVHRDFKPSNVMAGDDGRVRVLDFGIATRSEDAPNLAVTRPMKIRDITSSAGPDDRLTVDGAVVGTPAFMAPEQTGKYTPDARSDQYSFCVTLREMLQLRLRLYAAEGQSAAEAYELSWIDQILRKGTAEAPEQRYPDMNALLAAIDSAPERAKRRYREAANAMVRVWDDERRATVRERFAQSPHSADLFDRLESEIDSYTDDLINMSLSKQGREGAMEQEQRLLGLRSLVDELVNSADRSVLGAAVGAVYNLKASPVPQTPVTDADAAENEILAVLARVETLQGLGRLTEALQLLAEHMPAAEAVASSGTRALAYFLRGDLLERTGEYAAAEASVEEAVLAAAKVSDPVLLARAWIKLLWIQGCWRGKASAALALPLVIEAALFACHEPAVLRCSFLNAYGAVLTIAGRNEEAKTKHEEALALRLQCFGERHPDVAQSHVNLVPVLMELGDVEMTKVHLQQAKQIYIETLGPDHVALASVLCGIADILVLEGRFDDALAEILSAQRIVESSAGRQSPRLIPIWLTRAEALKVKGDPEDARASFATALKISEGVLDPEHPYVQLARAGLAR